MITRRDGVDTALVVPSIRADSFQRFLREWQPTGLFDRVDLVLMEDNPEPTFDTQRVTQAHYSWKDIDATPIGRIIPRRSDTVRSYGYLQAWLAGYDYLMTLDDDCYPAQGYEQLDLIHKGLLTRTRWFNTLNSVRPRGVPYFNTGKRDVHINHGIWQGVLDYDAPQQLVDPVPETYTHDNRIVPYGAYHPFCGMNAIWRSDAMVLSYHLLMGSMRRTTKIWAPSPGSFVAAGGGSGQLIEQDSVTIERLPFDRFGDIWCGIIQKKVCDHLGWVVSTGTPYIHHDRASSPFTNLRKEANGIEVNEWFWEKIDAIDLSGILRIDGGSESAALCYREIGQRISTWDGEHTKYWNELGNAMVTWAELFL